MKNPSSCSEAVPDSVERQGALFEVEEFRPDEAPPPEALPPGDAAVAFGESSAD